MRVLMFGWEFPPHISGGLGTACYVKGSGDVYKKICDTLKIEGGQCTDDLRFSLDATRCIGACGLAPAVMVNDEVHPKMTPEKMSELIKKLREEEE